MSRRASDKTRGRLLVLLAALAFLSSALSSYIGYKAIRAIDAFAELLQAVGSEKREKSLLPEGY